VIHAEVAALDLAVEWVSKVLPEILQKMHAADYKRVRFS